MSSEVSDRRERISPEERGSQTAGGTASTPRFPFGRNWLAFLRTVDEDAIEKSMEAIRDMIGGESLTGARFLDVGCGSGLSSLAARRLGARVHSFDYDRQSVECARELKRRFAPEDSDWSIDQGSALDRAYLARLGTFDVVYSWGVLHHTGRMWEALGHMPDTLSAGGVLFISIYNDQGWRSRVWKGIKRLYVTTPRPLRFMVVLPVMLRLWGPVSLFDLLRGRPGSSLRAYARRGMSPYHDLIDWVGGYPFEVAKPEEIFRFYRQRGLELVDMTTVAGSFGCNQFVFRRRTAS
jgi:2-polyprenyl-3-methyl-5-hydroxy-6-metoxy-1,4-benzoquinol methylase